MPISWPRLIRFTKLVALAASVQTLLTAVLIAGFQISSWIRTGTWDAYSVSMLIASLKDRQDGIYVTASSPKSSSNWSWGELTSVMLETPAIIPVLAILSLLIIFLMWLKRLEQREMKEIVHADAGGGPTVS